MARERLAGDGVKSYLWDFFRLQYCENPGAFLGLGSALPDVHRFWLFTVLVLMLLVAILALMFTERARTVSVTGFSLILAGGDGGSPVSFDGKRSGCLRRRHEFDRVYVDV